MDEGKNVIDDTLAAHLEKVIQKLQDKNNELLKIIKLLITCGSKSEVRRIAIQRGFDLEGDPK